MPDNNNNNNSTRTSSSLYKEKLIPENVVPDIVELLVTLGLIQQQANTNDNADNSGSSLSSGVLLMSSVSTGVCTFTNCCRVRGLSFHTVVRHPLPNKERNGILLPKLF